MRGQVNQARSVRGQPCPQVDVAERIGAERADAAFIVVREKFRFVSRYVDAYGAIAFAALAGEA